MVRSQNDFEIVITADGSPSLRISDPTGYVEKMHHSAGALSESIYIYGEAVKMVLDRGWPLRVLSLGLGLGYNEVLVAGLAVQHGVAPADARITSFETEPYLVQSLTTWLREQPGDWNDLYRDIFEQTAKALNVPPQSLSDWLRDAHCAGTWRIHGAFPDPAADMSGLTCVLYDAFSNKMSPELWDENLIRDSIRRFCADTCVFATYAATGSLNRALRTEGFLRQERHGFRGKRESTLATREAQLAT